MDLNIPPPSQLSIDITGSKQHQIWEEWRERLENYFLVTNVQDTKRKKAMLIYFGGEHLKSIYKTLNDRHDTYKSAVCLLNDYFEKKKNLAVERFQFRQAVQLKEESMKTYVTRLWELSRYCKFDDYSNADAILDQVIEHCYSRDIRKKLLSEPDLTVEKVIEIATLKEEVDVQASVMEKKEMVYALKQNDEKDSLKSQKKTTQSVWRSKATCFGCGTVGHIKNEDICPAKGKSCNYCKRKNHFESMCLVKQKPAGHTNSRAVEQVEVKALNSSEDCEYIFSLNLNKNYDVECFVDEIPIRFKIDSGASVMVVSQKVGKKLEKSGLKLHETNVRIFPYGSCEPLKLEGVIYSNVRYGDNHVLGRIHVVGNWDSDCILDRKSAQQLGLLHIHSEASVNMLKSSTPLVQLSQEYPKVFNGFGKLKNVEVEFDIDKDVKPVSQHLRRMPFHVRKKVQRKIEELINLDIIEEVNEATPWVSPVQAVPKGEDVRLVLDMRQANRAIKRTHYPVPTLDELLEEFNGKTVYSKLDLLHGYHQIPLAEESRKLTTFITHSGLYRFKRLVQGASGALEAYQYYISSLFASHPGISNISDDILIGGVDQTEHDTNLRKCLQILEDNNLTVNEGKCEISVSKITFFGHSISAKGIHPEISKVDAIKSFPEPTCRKEISSFLGMITYLARFVPGLSAETEVLRKLLRKDTPWSWGKDEKNAFIRLKNLISSDMVVAHFDTSLETSIIVDAGPVGLGAILVQKQKDGTLRPVHFASRTLTDVERRYSQTEREALAVIFGCERFHLYLYGQRFTILTDHNPLTVLYNHSGKPSPRILRWGLRLMSYDYEIKHIPGKTNPADMLSICPMPHSEIDIQKSDQTEEYINSLLVYNIPKAVTLSEVIEESKNDLVLQEVIESMNKESWTSKIPEIVPYKKVKNQLAYKSGIVFKEDRLVIPQSLRERILKIAHEHHQGIVKTKSLLREKVWWPNIDKEVETMIKSCIPCLSVSNSDPPEPMKTHVMSGPWEKVHVDLCGPFPSGEYILGIVDANSRWPELHIIKSTTSDTIVDCLDRTFTTHGYPDTIITDNASNLTSVKCEDYCMLNGIKHQKSIPYWPQGNSEVERFYKTILKTIRTCNTEGRDWRKEIFKFLLTYRNTPHCTTKKTPAMLLMNRTLKDKLPTISHISDAFKEAQGNDQLNKQKSKQFYDEKKNVKKHLIQVGDDVMMKQDKDNKLTTAFNPNPYKVVKVEGPAITIQDGDQKFIRNAAHLKVIPVSQGKHGNDSNPDAPNVKEVNPNLISPDVEVHQRPTRIRKRPDRYTDEWIDCMNTV